MPPVMSGRRRHRGQPEQQAEARAEGGAGEDDEEEDARAAAGQVDQPEQAGHGREHAEHGDGGAGHRAPPHLEGDGEHRQERRRPAATSGASPAWASLSAVSDGSQNG